MFESTKSKEMWVQTVKKERDVKVQKGELTVQGGDDLVEGYSKGITLTSFLTKIRSDGTVAVFINVLGNAAEQSKAQKEGTVYWHAYAIFYERGVLAVYDPSFDQGNKDLHSCTGVTLAKELVKALKGKKANHKVTEVWFGGGGNNGRDC